MYVHGARQSRHDLDQNFMGIFTTLEDPWDFTHSQEIVDFDATIPTIVNPLRLVSITHFQQLGYGKHRRSDNSLFGLIETTRTG